MKYFKLGIALYFLKTDTQTNETLNEILINCFISKENSVLEII